MFEYFLELSQSGGSINTNLNYVSNRMDSILEAMLISHPYELLIEIFSSMGILMLLVYFSIDLLDKVTDMQFSLEILFKQLVKLVALYALMAYLPELLLGFAEFQKYLNQGILDILSGNIQGEFWADIASTANKVNGATDMEIDDAGGILQTISSIGMQTVMQFLTWSLSIDRALRIGYKSIIAPIACADMISNGMSSNGIRYLKSILSLYLQSTVMLLMMICVNEVCTGLSSEFSAANDASLWTVIVGLFILWNTTKRTKEIADEII